jgi:hypothetical protein
MATKRTPIARDTRNKITPAAIAAFERMRRARSEEAYDAARSDLIDELQLMPWEGALIDDPSTPNPYPPGSAAAQSWDQRAEQPEAFTLFRALAAAAAAARAARAPTGAAAPAEAAPVQEAPARRRARSRRSPAWGAPRL